MSAVVKCEEKQYQHNEVTKRTKSNPLQQELGALNNLKRAQKIFTIIYYSEMLFIIKRLWYLSEAKGSFRELDLVNLVPVLYKLSFSICILGVGGNLKKKKKKNREEDERLNGRIQKKKDMNL